MDSMATLPSGHEHCMAEMDTQCPIVFIFARGGF